jgi:hypothetical protein
MKAYRSELADKILQDREASQELYKAIFESNGSDRAFKVKTKIGTFTVQKMK